MIERDRERRVIAGVLLGLIASTVFFWTTVPLAAGVGAPWVLVLVGVLPLAVGVVALLVPSWRRAGAGLVLGLGIGSIVYAGGCVAVLGWLTSALG